jgi:MSHA biogenesis protein MshP
VLAVFIITVLAALGAYIVTISAVQHQTVALSIQEARALDAARAGAEWKSQDAINNLACDGSTQSVTLAAATLASFNVSTTCDGFFYFEGWDMILVFRIDSTATGGTYGSPDYVSRHVQRTITTSI